ncbi:50S ribosomal protein L25 [Paenibacillus sp. J22TS3]|uniref:50S ribosomal protein L25 n=1 Tax=Paenibacillus sp. J22TS3 TaxID=2807192 RepID=UPI001B25F42D|nr:50S ribosomal protein L25 [Paenibacillus sp. J22TS3]GIP20747.1 50S ribosomal protein L25 [Paenibacillus sp. J22TS3]
MSTEHNLKLNAEKRTNLSNSSLRQLREKGRIPGVVYGTQIGSVSLHVDAKELLKVARTGRSEFFQLSITDGESFPALIKDVQQQGGKVIHVDFQHVSKNKPIRVKVPIHYNGTAEGTKTGGILQIQETELEVEGLPDSLPAGIDIDVTGLGAGDKLTAAEVKLPEGVTLISSEESLLASIVLPRAADTAVDEPSGEAAEGAGDETADSKGAEEA